MNIATIRTDRGLTQEDLATMLGVTVQTVRNWESGRTHPGKKTHAVAVALKCTEVELFSPLTAPAADQLGTEVAPPMNSS